MNTEYECPICGGGPLYQDKHDQAKKVAHCDDCGEVIPEKEYIKIVKISFVDRLYEEHPCLKNDGINEFDGYFVSYDQFIKKMEQAWPERTGLDYNSDPFELIDNLINERDEALEKLKWEQEKTKLKHI